MELAVVAIISLVAIGVGVGVGIRFASSSVRQAPALAGPENEAVLHATAAEREALIQAAHVEAERLRLAALADFESQKAELGADFDRLEQKEAALQRRLEALDQRDRDANRRVNEVRNRNRDLEQLRGEQSTTLQRVGDLPWSEARELIAGRVEAEMNEEGARRTRALVNATKIIADEEARGLISQVIQRLPAEKKADSLSSVVPIAEDARARLLAREGRNIKALAAAADVELLTDEVPGAIVISSFDPIKREIARQSLNKLAHEGRIHPGRVEEVVAKATRDTDLGMVRSAKQAAAAAGIHGLHPDILKVFGRLKYRTSYGQNQLLHSVEVSQIARMLAVELGANPDVAARGALLHDIGKVMGGHEADGPHHVIGAELVRRSGESGLVADAIVEHHDSDPETVSVEAVIVQAADAISGARPGARHESAEQYIKRLEALEQVASSFPGVEKSFAIQAGREIRIIVKPEEIDEIGSAELALVIAKQIESTLQYPGQVKVTVVRETRATEIAR